MSKWRTLGYVPDSDEEDEFIDARLHQAERDEAEHNRHRLSVTDGPTTDHHIVLEQDSSIITAEAIDNTTLESTASKLEQTLNHGLQTVRDLLGSATLSINSDHDEDDSPLSSPPSSPVNSPSTPAAVNTEAVHAVNESGIPFNHDVSFRSPRRTLRTRAPIQEHPYMLEDAKYRQLMKDRGIKPVLAPTTNKSSHPTQNEEDSQQTEDFNDSQAGASFDFDVPSSPIVQNLIQDPLDTNEDSVSYFDVLDDAEDELPELADILRHRPEPLRKVYKAKSKLPRPTTQLSTAATAHEKSEDTLDQDNSDHASTSSAVFQVPPSPPGSQQHVVSSGEEVVTSSRKKHRTSYTPIGLPTPLVSSGQGSRKRPVAIVSSSEASQSSEEEDDAVSVQSSHAEEEDSQGIQWIRQKLRGVLPPSYLKLNMPTQAPSRAKQQTIHASATPANERGVARRATASSGRISRWADNSIFQLSESEFSDSDNHQQPSIFDGDRQTSYEPLPASIIDDVFEDNEIDHMLPSASSRRRRTISNKPRQQRIDNEWAISNHRSAQDAISAGLVGEFTKGRQAKRKSTTNRKRTKSAHKRQPARMRILDAPGFQELNKDSQPRFLKLAARQAKAKHNTGQKASAKFFLLATEDDTRDVNDQVQAWKASRSGSKRTHAVAGTKLPTTTANHTLRNFNDASQSADFPPALQTSTTDLNKLKRSTNLLLSRLSTSGQKPSSLGQAIHNITSSEFLSDANKQNKRSQLKYLFAHRNRSGQGQFETRAPEPRSAQIEVENYSVQSTLRLPIRLIPKRQNNFRVTSARAPENPSDNIKDTNGSAPKPSRKPKKQTPKQSTIATAKTNFNGPLNSTNEILNAPNVVESITMEETQQDTGATRELELLARSAIYSIGELMPLRSETTFLNNAIANGSLFKVEVYYRKPTSIWTVVRFSMCEIQTPITKVATQCRHFDDQVKTTISTTLDEVQQALFGGLQIYNSTQHHKMCVKSLKMIVKYLEVAAFFQDTPDTSASEYLSTFIHDTAEWIQNFLNALPQLDSDDDADQRDTILRCLNWLVILALYLHKYAQALDSTIQLMMDQLCRRLIHQTFTVILTKDLLRQSLIKIHHLCTATAIESQIDQNFPEAEAVVLAWHALGLLSTEYSAKPFFDLVRDGLCMPEAMPSANRLARSCLAMCFILPLIQFTSRGSIVRVSADVEDIDGASFKLLAEYTQEITSRSPSNSIPLCLSQLLEAVGKLVSMMTRTWCWKVPAIVATTSFRAYAWNMMLPFNSVPSEQNVFEDHECLALLGRDQTEDTLSRFIRYENENDFFRFLGLVSTCLKNLAEPEINADGESIARVPGQIRVFIYGLMPNNVPIINAESSLQAGHYLGIKNHFALLVILYTKSPNGFQPRIKQLEQQVNFRTAHFNVCRLAITTWKTISMAYVQRTDPWSKSQLLQGMSNWMNTMLNASLDSFSENRQMGGIGLIELLLTAFTEVVTCCGTESTARMLFEIETFTTIARLVGKPEIHSHNENIIIAGTKLFYAYASLAISDPIEKTHTFEIQLALKQLISTILQNREYSQPIVLRNLMSAWFLVAKNMVQSFHKHWNDFIEPHSSLSIDFMSGLRETYATYEAKELFYSELLDTDRNFVFLECRPTVFMTWIATLLLPVQSFNFPHILTNAILRTERDSLMIRDLTLRLSQTYHNPSLSAQQVADSRLIILRHIIHNIYGQVTDPEEEWLAGGLNAMAQKDLLRTITKTMKATLIDLKQFPAAHSDYTALVHAIINELETYPVPGFKIDSWFYGINEFARQSHSLDKLFKCPFGESAPAIQIESVRDFISQYTASIDSKHEDIHLSELIRVFHCTDPLRVRVEKGVTQYSIDIEKQTKFMQIVFPAIIERGSSRSNSTVMAIVLDLLTETTKNLGCRIDNLTSVNMNQYFAMTAAVLLAVRKVAEITQLAHQEARRLVRFTRVALGKMLGVYEYGVDIDESLREMCVGNVLGIYLVVQTHLSRWLAQLQSIRDVEAYRNPQVEEVEEELEIDEEEEIELDDGEVCVMTREGCVKDTLALTFKADVDLVPADKAWTLFFEREEPELEKGEKALREEAKELLALWEQRAMPPAGAHRANAGAVEEMMGLVEDLRRRELFWSGDESEEE